MSDDQNMIQKLLAPMMQQATKFASQQQEKTLETMEELIKQQKATNVLLADLYVLIEQDPDHTCLHREKTTHTQTALAARPPEKS